MRLELKTMVFFVQGIVSGIFCGGIVLLLNQASIGSDILYMWSQVYQWLVINLGVSAILFILILLAYAYIYKRIQRSLLQVSSENWKRIVYDEQLLEMLTSLAFGVGVIWTAIGMREALMAAFGGDEMSGLASKGALGMLDQLINGGILTALTSTVTGGVMGYVLRIFKTLTLAFRINNYQEALLLKENSEEGIR